MAIKLRIAALFLCFCVLAGTGPARGAEATCPLSVTDMLDALTKRFSATDVIVESRLEGLAQWAGYIVGKGLASAEEGSKAHACLKQLDARLQRTQESKGLGAQYTAGFMGLRPVGLDESIDGDAVVAIINSARPDTADDVDEMEDAWLVAWRLVNTWELVALSFTVGDQTDHAQVNRGFYVVDIRPDGRLRQKMMQNDGTWGVWEGAWQYQHSGHTLTLAPMDEPPFVSTVVSISFERLVIVSYDDESEVTQTMTFEAAAE